MSRHVTGSRLLLPVGAGRQCCSGRRAAVRVPSLRHRSGRHLSRRPGDHPPEPDSDYYVQRVEDVLRPCGGGGGGRRAAASWSRHHLPPLVRQTRAGLQGGVHRRRSCGPGRPGTLEDDLTAVVQSLVEEFPAPASQRALPGLLADFAAAPELRVTIRSRFVKSAKQRLPAVFDQAQLRGETSDPPVDLVLDTLAGAVFVHPGIAGERPEPDLARRIAAMPAKGIEFR
ncbi:TetR-like C-terminal domain-containing protein [Streptomyces sp. NPDC051310]|uniref:TetR-like C-terminal domain-containing protein n=1 Tax=Streptomyces sp. NPDC051310 TaxID=3365649 RepID=UPI0037A1C7B6